MTAAENEETEASQQEAASQPPSAGAGAGAGAGPGAGAAEIQELRSQIMACMQENQQMKELLGEMAKKLEAVEQDAAETKTQLKEVTLKY